MSPVAADLTKNRRNCSRNHWCTGDGHPCQRLVCEPVTSHHSSFLPLRHIKNSVHTQTPSAHAARCNQSNSHQHSKMAPLSNNNTQLLAVVVVVAMLAIPVAAAAKPLLKSNTRIPGACLQVAEALGCQSMRCLQAAGAAAPEKLATPCRLAVAAAAGGNEHKTNLRALNLGRLLNENTCPTGDRITNQSCFDAAQCQSGICLYWDAVGSEACKDTCGADGARVRLEGAACSCCSGTFHTAGYTFCGSPP